jgi:hypothetical protein
METKEEELSRCRSELAYWTKEGVEYFIWYYTERIKEENDNETLRDVEHD